MSSAISNFSQKYPLDLANSLFLLRPEFFPRETVPRRTLKLGSKNDLLNADIKGRVAVNNLPPATPPPFPAIPSAFFYFY